MSKVYVENIPMLAQRFAKIFVKFRIRFRGKTSNENACVVVPVLRAPGGKGSVFEVDRKWRMLRVCGRERF